MLKMIVSCLKLYVTDAVAFTKIKVVSNKNKSPKECHSFKESVCIETWEMKNNH